MTQILLDLKEFIKREKRYDIPDMELIDRMINRVEEENVDERMLIIEALEIYERVKAGQKIEALELATRNRRELLNYYYPLMNDALHRRNSRDILRLREVKKLLCKPMDTTRKMDTATIDLAQEVKAVLQAHPDWNMKDVAVKHFGDIGEYGRIRKAMSRYNKMQKREKRRGSKPN